MDRLSFLDEPIGADSRAFPEAVSHLPLREIGTAGLNLAAGDMPLPVLVIREAALAHNVATMAAWCKDRRVSLAPHGKTTMAPQIFQRQLAAGAWAVSAATVSQAAMMRRYRVRRVLIANEVVDATGLRWLAETTRDDRGFEVICLVDSRRGAELLEAALVEAGGDQLLPVLLEVGVEGHRAGARSQEGAREVAAAIDAAGRLRLAGIECFEGVIGPGAGPEQVAAVDLLIERVAALARELDAQASFGGGGEIILSAGGSAFFDRASRLVNLVELSLPVRVVLRSGCYVTHDSGVYDELSPLGGVRRRGGARLRPALELWCSVLSRPESDLAILGFGKRDASFDAGLPRLLRAARTGGARIGLGRETEIFRLHDHHAFMRVPDGLELSVGDQVTCGISHPCTALDKWSLLPVVDEADMVIGAVRTFFG